MSQHSNDPKGVNLVINDAGTIIFRRADQGASAVVLVTGTIVTTGWCKPVMLHKYLTIASKTGAVTVFLASHANTATTGAARTMAGPPYGLP
jgi:hypothetical protein